MGGDGYVREPLDVRVLGSRLRRSAILDLRAMCGFEHMGDLTVIDNGASFPQAGPQRYPRAHRDDVRSAARTGSAQASDRTRRRTTIQCASRTNEFDAVGQGRGELVAEVLGETYNPGGSQKRATLPRPGAPRCTRADRVPVASAL